MDDLPTESDLVIGTSSSRILVTIKPDGRLIYGPDYTPDEAAAVLWQTLARQRAREQDKEILFLHMQKLLLEAGRADLEKQKTQDLVNELAATGSKVQRTQANLANSRADGALHQAAYRLIELGRAMALGGAEDPVSPPSPSTILS